ncbi:MAG: class I SAM-dependent methyltransferase [Dehalococcoidia bacterium]|nr:class I SAM-dependent methyltransferase [Dehalococcoidia bacterium]
MSSRFQSLYFDRVYTPAYDLTVAQLPAYQHLQSSSLARVSVFFGCEVLVVGSGTGNELLGLLQRPGGPFVSLTAVDLSRRSLVRASRKARRQGKAVEVLQMNAQRLAFADGQFDRVLCLHTMDFLADPAVATREIVRVLRKGGEFIISYPSGEGIGGVAGVAARSVLEKLRRGKLTGALKEALASMGAAVAYAPLALSVKPQRLIYSRPELERLMASLEISDYGIEEDGVYRDFIVWGRR